jgi:[protein-PII] uridylyltransferase
MNPVSRATDPPIDLRARATTLKTLLLSEQDALRRAYFADGNAAALLHAHTDLVDRVLSQAWHDAGVQDNLALVAVGGFGRGEMYPASDVDILILVPDDDDARAYQGIEALIGLCWDVGLELGHSVRSIAHCLEEANRDITVETTLLESRFLAGDRSLYDRFAAALGASIRPETFFKAKRLEQEERYARHNDTPYSLEPNCKESPGGLRDLQTILWITRASELGTRWADLAARQFITALELRQLRNVEEFLQNTRIRLHYMARRHEDRLLFDHQEALAQGFGVHRTAAHRASELFMQRYFRNAKLVTQLNTILLQNIGAEIFPSYQRATFGINERFQMERELLDVRSEDVFERYPTAIIESFMLMQERSELKGMTARTLRALWRSRSLITPAFRRDPTNRALFLKFFQQRRGIVHELRRMNQYGILGRMIPAFGKVVGQMQHDLFHVYTVDQHILQVVRNLRRYTMAEHAHEYPFCSRLIAGFERPWLLYIAAMFHDIAKGRGGNHSVLGMRDARRFCRDYGIVDDDADLVVFLVGHHLSMSALAQKQDLTDPEIIRSFAAIVKTERRLIALYLLTVSDIRGTSPKVWNAWKGKLLEDLFRLTLRLLRGDAPAPAAGLAERQEDARTILRYRGLRSNVEAALWEQLDTVYFMRHDADEIAWHTRTLYHRPHAAEPVIKARLNPIGEGLQVMVYVRDQPDLFARICGLFSRYGLSIAEAKVHTTRHGYALDSFVLLDPAHQLTYRDATGLIEHELAERLLHQAPLEKPTIGRLSRQVRHFPITPEVGIRPDERGSHYIMSLTAADRPGLLYAIATVLSRHHLNLHTAKIATLGERVEDTFLINGNALAQTAKLLQIEQELLEVLAV